MYRSAVRNGVFYKLLANANEVGNDFGYRLYQVQFSGKDLLTMDSRHRSLNIGMPDLESCPW